MASMVENAPINIMFADRDNIIRYMNPASLSTLRTLSHILPVPPDKIIGISVDRFHKNPEHQRAILSDPARLPVQADIQVGDETLDLLVSPIFDESREYIGAMATWSITTERIQAKKDASDLAESINCSTSEIASSIQEISAKVTQTASLTSSTKSRVEEANSKLSQLADYGRGIEEIVKVIQTMSDQTNLLALNATIEAARAGEAGKGFAVVASEVKELAKSTIDATKRIQEQVDDIQCQISEVIDATTSVAESVDEVDGNTSAIASAVEEQSAVMKELSGVAETLQE